jgi:PmbA protein
MANLQDLAREFLDWVRARDRGVEAEVYLARSDERGVEMREGNLDNVQQGSSEGAGLRVLRGGRMGFACAGGVTPEILKSLYSKVSEQIEHLEPDACRDLPALAAPRPDPGLEASLWDDSLFVPSLTARVERLAECHAVILRQDRRLSGILRAGYGESRGETVIANTRGVFSRDRGTSVSVGFSALARDGEDIQIGSAFQSACKATQLDFQRVARQAAERAVSMLDSRKLPTGSRVALFDPWSSGEILGLVAELLCADQVQRGKSLLAGKLGQPVGSALATFIDDPRIPGGLGSCLHDDEGLPTRRKVMIEAGIVKEFFYDTYTACKDGRQGNASAGRGSYKGMPSPTHSNFYLAPGHCTREELIARTQDGIMVTEIMGMHMADPISGQFSVGVSGFAVSDGRLGHPVKKAMISGSLLDILAGIDGVADDLTFYGSLGAPTFRVARINVA